MQTADEGIPKRFVSFTGAVFYGLAVYAMWTLATWIGMRQELGAPSPERMHAEARLDASLGDLVFVTAAIWVVHTLTVQAALHRWRQVSTGALLYLPIIAAVVTALVMLFVAPAFGVGPWVMILGPALATIATYETALYLRRRRCDALGERSR